MTMNPLKPNLCIVVIALLAMAWIGYKVYVGLFDAIPTLLNPDAGTGDVKDGIIQILLHLLTGTLLIPIAGGLVAMGVKLLDEGPAEPGVPASTHENLVKDAIAAGHQLQRLEEASKRLDTATGGGT